MKVHGMWKGAIVSRDGESMLAHSYHQFPMKVAKPFREGSDFILYLMDSSPGLFNGDTQEIECTLETGAHLFLTNQSSCKLHPSLNPAESCQIQRFVIKEGAVLEYFPEPIVPLRGANYRGEMTVHIEQGGKALIGEIITPGRAGRGEFFQYEKISSQFSAYWKGKWIVWDSLLLEPAEWENMTGILDHYTHIATLWVLAEDICEEHVRVLREDLSNDTDETLYHGVSLLSSGGLVIRMLGYSVWSLQMVMNVCWERLRKDVLNKDPLKIRK